MKARVLFFFMLTAGSLLRAQLPTGANVVAGDVNVTQAANTMTVTQASRNAIVNWQSFNLGADATFRLQQSGVDAAMLARVVGNDPSKLLGSLKADGKLFLINPKGIVVGQGAVIDTAAFLASTLDVSDDNFLRGGELAFKGDSAAGVVNYGKITAREGNVFLFAHTVKNAGEINAAKGTVGMGAGTEVLLASPDVAGFVIKTNLPATTEKTGVENSGVIAAAQAQLEAAGGSIYDLAVNQSGVVRATGSEIRNGRVLLTANGGTVGVSGEITAQNKNGSGGEIIVGGDYRGQNSAVPNATRTIVTSTAKLDASAATDAAKAGRVIVWADDATRFLGTLKATGAGGGFAEVSGKRWLDFNPNSVLQLGTGGTLLLDPDALVISTAANSGTSTSGTNPFTFTATTEPATLNVTTLQNQLATSNVILDTSTSTGDITFDAAVSWANSNALTVRSGNNITINADIAGGTGSTLALYTGRRASPTNGGESGLPEVRGEGWLDSSATIKVGTLIYGANALSNPGQDYTTETPANVGNLFLNGNIDVGVLEADLSAGAVGLSTQGAHNAIGAFRTSGNGVLRSAYIVDHAGDLDVTLNSSGGDSTYLQFITSGNLTLKAGSAVSFTDASTVTLAAKNGAFTNQAGANVFGANARFLIYSSTTSATTKGGLTGTDGFNHPFDEADFFDDALSRFFFTAFSGAPVLTYTADSFTRTYGAANPAFTFTRSGLVNGVTDDVTGAPTLSATVAQSSGVGAYAINIGLGTLASNNYDFNFVNGTLTIDRAPLTVTANDKTRRINLANPDFDARYSGFVLGETPAALGGTLSFATTAAQASPAGTYAITPSGFTSSNYAISFLPGTLTLTETAALLISANSFNRTYGAVNPAFTASYSGFVGSDTESIVSGLQFSTLATQSSGVGTYTITPFGATATGYDITYAPGTLTIDRASLTISVPNQARTYGAANNLAVNYNGLVNGDTSSVVTGLSLATSATPTSNVGTYGITASGAMAANYSILYSQGSLSVTPAPITVTLNHATRRYGDADPVFTFSIGGLQNGDSESLINVGPISSLADATAGVGSYGLIAFPGTTSANYSVPTQVAGSMTITPRPLTITANNFTRVYGDANPTFTATFDGLASFDTSALFGDLGLTTPATQTSGVGNWGITFPTVANANYAITSQSGTLAITPAPLTFSPLIELSRVYGRANPALILPEVGGLKLSDTVANLGLAFEAPALTANVGTYAYRLTTTNPNYSLGTGATGEFRVTPAPLTVAIGSAGRVYGDATPINYDLRVTGLAFDDSASSVVSVFDPTEARTDVGTYPIESRLLNPNYFVNSATNGSLVISPRVLTLTAADRTRIYGDIDPFFFGSITGFLPGDSELNIITNLGYVTNATQASSVGNYWIRPSAQTTTANYVINPVEGALSITRAPLSVTIANASRTYGQANPTFSAASAQGLKNQDTTASLGLTFSTNATTSSDVGFYTILGQSASANYTVSFDPGVLTINRASASIAANTASRIFGNLFTANPFSLTFTGFLAADEVVARGNWQLTFTDDATFAPGGHAIGFSTANVLTTAALSKNYDITLQAGTLNVTARPLTITVPDMKFLLGSVVPATVDFGTPDLPAGSPAFTVVGQRTSADGKTTIVPEIVPGPGVTRAELDRYFTFELKSGAVSFTFDPQDVDLNHQLRLTLNPNDTPINRDNTTTEETIEVDKPQKLNLTANPYVPFDTQPLTKADYANYFSSFANTTEAVKTALAGGYSEFLTGKGKSGSAYEGMTAAARQMLAGWMSGSVSTADLSALIAAGNADAASAFGFILPTLVDQTRAKNVADMTMMDRQILGRLADLTEKRNTQTIQLAQQKYEAMLVANAKKAEMNGLGSILLGPGDFKALVADASNEAITNYITATIGAGGVAGASGVALMSIQSVVTSLFPFASSAATTAASIGGPAIAVSMAVVLAVRATQISESINNENDYNALINSWKVGQEITSISQLKSPAMNQDLKLSTLMLSAELFSSTP